MEPPPLPKNIPEHFARRNAAALKLLFIAFLALLLLVPLHLVDSTLRERRSRHDEAVGRITQTWGRGQRLLGPVLVVPYTYRTQTDDWVVATDGRRYREKTTHTHTAEAYFLPDVLEADGAIDPAARRLGIYSTHVYTAALKLSGRFAPPDFSFTGVATPEPQWAAARVCLAIADLRGTREALTIRWGGIDAPLQPGARLGDGLGSGLHAPVKLSAGGGPIEFALDLTLNGSGGLGFVPLGRQTTVTLASPWASPGFVGNFPPTERTVSDKGFTAKWQVSFYGRDFPQQWSPNVTPAPSAAAIEAAGFGVNLVEPVTAYRTIERAIKYGVLFVALVFVTFFLFETLSRVRLNALNYLLVGAALCLFFLGLLSLAEFIGFTPAYAMAAGASLLLVVLYARSVLRSVGRALLVGGMLGVVYCYLYFTLQMEDFSLLAGTAALFALLAAVMFATRRMSETEMRGDAAVMEGAAS